MSRILRYSDQTEDNRTNDTESGAVIPPGKYNPCLYRQED